MIQAVATDNYLAGKADKTAPQGDCPSQSTVAAEGLPKAALIRVRFSAAILTILLHTIFLLLGFWLSGATSAVKSDALPRFLSVTLDQMPPANQATQQATALPDKFSAPPKFAAVQHRISTSLRPETDTGEETLAQKREGSDKIRTDQAAAETVSPVAETAGQMFSTAKAPVEIVARPLYETNPPPLYPRLAKRLGQQGVVLLAVLVSVSGLSEEIKVASGSGHELLDEAALKAVRGWRFSPGSRDGRPVAMWVRVPVRFELRG